MLKSETLLPEFDHEMATTRAFFQRLPLQKMDWQPHPKSGTLGWLANHIRELPAWVPNLLTTDSIDMSSFQPPTQLVTIEEILARFDKNVADARAAIVATSDEAFMKPWSLLFNGQTIFSMPRIAVLRTMVTSHMIHHRAQLGLYFRLNDVPVPSTYGPSADEKM